MDQRQQRHRDRERINEWKDIPPLTFLMRDLTAAESAGEKSTRELLRAATNLQDALAWVANSVLSLAETAIRDVLQSWKELEQLANDTAYAMCVFAISTRLREELSTNVHMQQYMIESAERNVGILEAMQERNVVLRSARSASRALHRAVELGMHNNVRALVPFVDVNAVNEEGLTPLAVACTQQDVAIIDMLISNSETDTTCTFGADGWFPLLLAVRLKSTELVSKLLQHAKTQVNQCTEPGGLCSLTYACRCSETEVIKMLLQHKDIDTDNNGPRQNNITPLNTLVLRDRPDLVKMLLAARCNPNKPSFMVPVYNYRNVDGFHAQPLLLAIQQKHYAVAELLVRCKSIDLSSPYLLWEAAFRNKNNNMTQLLIVHGSDPTALRKWPFSQTAASLERMGIRTEIAATVISDAKPHVLTAVEWGFQNDADAMLRQGRLGTLSVSHLKKVMHQQYFVTRFARGWRPTTHNTYDDVVRAVVNTVMLIWVREHNAKTSPQENVLPLEIWMHVFKFLCRSHFEAAAQRRLIF